MHGEASQVFIDCSETRFHYITRTLPSGIDYDDVGDKAFNLAGSSDYDYAGYIIDRKSTTSFEFLDVVEAVSCKTEESLSP